MLEVGTLLRERYRILMHVGKGGMGTVFQAKDENLGITVAIKQNSFGEQRLIEAFKREARLLAGLRHSALPQVKDYFIDDTGQYLVMDYIAGEDLGTLLQKRNTGALSPDPLSPDQGSFDVNDVVLWAEQLLDALDYLHTRTEPIIHRDIKPQNLKVGERNQIILLDFGLAKGKPLWMTRVSTTGSLYGYTPHYAPIEQIRGMGTDPRSDLYALGATLYHLLTGVPPLDSATRADAFLGSEPDPLQPPNRINHKVPYGIAATLMKALEPHRNNRFKSAAEMLKSWRDAKGSTVVEWDSSTKVRVDKVSDANEHADREWPTTEVPIQVMADYQQQKRGLIRAGDKEGRSEEDLADVRQTEEEVALLVATDSEEHKHQSIFSNEVELPVVEEEIEPVDEKEERSVRLLRDARRESETVKNWLPEELNPPNVAEAARVEPEADLSSRHFDGHLDRSAQEHINRAATELRPRENPEIETRGEPEQLRSCRDEEQNAGSETERQENVGKDRLITRVIDAETSKGAQVLPNAADGLRQDQRLDFEPRPVRVSERDHNSRQRAHLSASARRERERNFVVGGIGLSLVLSLSLWLLASMWRSPKGLTSNSQPATSLLIPSRGINDPKSAAKLSADVLSTPAKVKGVALSDDGQVLASVGDEPSIRLWRKDSTTELGGNVQKAICVAVSHDGRFVASGCEDGTIRLWRISDAVTIKSWKAHWSYVSSVAFNSDGGTLLSAGGDKNLRFWRIPDGGLIKTVSVAEKNVSIVTSNPDSRLLAVYRKDGFQETGSVRMWSLRDTHLIKPLDGWIPSVICGTLSLDGLVLALGTRAGVEVWRVKEGKQMSKETGSLVSSVALSPDSQTIAAGLFDGSIKLFSIRGELIKVLSGHQSAVNGLSFSADGELLISGSDDKSVRIWSLAEH